MRALYDVPAPAKLNLFLHVVGRRADGYHLLQSVFVLIDWCDTLHFERRDDGRAAAPRPRRRAARRRPVPARRARCCRPSSGTRAGRRHLDRQAACPGAPAWAAAAPTRPRTLLALNRLWGLDWPRERLLRARPDARRRRAVLPRRPQRLRRGHRRAADADRTCRGSGWPSSSRPPASPRRRSSRSPALVRDTDAVILAGFLADAAQPCGFGARQGSAATTCSRRPKPLCPEVAQAAEWLQARSATAA